VFRHDALGNSELEPYRYTPFPPDAGPANARNGAFTEADTRPSDVAEYRPFGAKYEATYVVSASTATGAENDTSCQPEADSPENVAVANNDPDDDHKFPTCVPVFPAPLKNRTPVTVPATTERNFTPSSTAPVSSADNTSGVAPADQIENGPEPVDSAVVNDHVTGATNAFPATSKTPDTVAVYTDPDANAVAGENDAVNDPGAYELDPATNAFDASRSVNEIVAACTGSENVALDEAPTATSVASAVGVVAVTVGAIVSAPGASLVKTTSTQ
jgi:hypothetical protein